MNTYETTNTYAANGFKHTLFKSVEERNRAFGYDYLQHQPLQQRYHDSYMSNTQAGPVGDINRAPKDYYFDTRVDDTEKTVIGPLNTRPNIYNDVVVNYGLTFERPNLYKSWEPLSTTATQGMKGEYVRFIPNEKPCEVAPNNNPKLWVADLNAKMYERSLIQSAREQPYANWYARQGLQNLVTLNMPPNTRDRYTQKLQRPDDTFCANLKRNNGVPPAVLGM